MKKPRTVKPRMAWDRLFYSCPGAWYGTEPGHGVQSGGIAVSVEAVGRAAAFIERSRHFQIGAGSASLTGDGAIWLPVVRK